MNSRFSLFGFFVLICASTFSAVLLMSLAGVGWMFRSLAIASAEEHTGQVASYIRDRELAVLSSEDGKIVTPADEDLSALDARMHEFLARFDIVKIKVFAADTTIAYSTDQAIIGRQDVRNEKLRRALRGELNSHLESKDEVWDLEGEKRLNIDLVETYVPMRNSEGRIVGSFETYTDVSVLLSKRAEVLGKVFILLTVILLLAFVALSMLMHGAIRRIGESDRKITMLGGLLPICAWCKKVRDDEGYWSQIEIFLRDHSSAEFSHGICPECALDLDSNETM